MDLIVLAAVLVIALGAGVALIRTWGRTAALAAVPRWLVRGGLAALALIPIIVVVGLTMTASMEAPTASAPPDVEPTAPRPKRAKKAAPRPDDSERDLGEVGTPSEPAPTTEAPPEPGAAGPAAPDDTVGAPAPDEEPRMLPRMAEPGEGGSTRGLDDLLEEEPPAAGAPPPAPPASVPPPPPPPPARSAEPDSKWEIVPVFYGTDRTRIVNAAGRLDYGDGRGRRLELGEALVTVPKSHTVPQIERPWTLTIPFTAIEIGESEDPNEHFTMKEITTLTQEQLLARVGERLARSQRFRKHALIFVHGFNTTFDYAIYRTAQIAYDLKFDGASFAYSWPSGGGVLNYTYDRESSGQALPYLKEFVKMVLERSGAEAVSLVAHSMGNQPTLQLLKDLRASKPEGVLFNQIVLAAPDVDRDNFENIAAEIRGLARGVTLYAADNDKALAISRRVNGGVPRAGDVPPEGPLVIADVDTIDVSRASTDSLGLHHSGYAENNDLMADLKILIETGTRPPEKRINSTKIVTSPKGAYWQLVPMPKPPVTPASESPQ